MSESTTVPVPAGFFRTPEGMKCAESIEAWASNNPEAIEADERIARLQKLTAKPDGKGIGAFVIRAVSEAGEDGIPSKGLLAAVNKAAHPRRFDTDALSGFLKMQGIKTAAKPDAPLEEKEGVVYLTEAGEAKFKADTLTPAIEDAHKALVVTGYKKKSASAFIDLVLEADKDGKIVTSEDIVKAVTKSYKRM